MGPHAAAIPIVAEATLVLIAIGCRALLLLICRLRRPDGPDHPCVLGRVKLPNDSAWISDDYGVRRTTAGDQRISAYDGMMAQY